MSSSDASSPAGERPFKVRRTTDRTGARADYIIRLRRDRKRGENLGRFAVVLYDHPNLEDHPDVKLSVPARVVLDARVVGDEVSVDQTLRNALGIKFAFDEKATFVELAPLRVPWGRRFKNHVAYWFGCRYLVFRVSHARISDLEKDIVRLPTESFKLLGCEDGDRVVIEQAVRQEDGSYRLRGLSARAYAATDQMIGERRKDQDKEMEQGLYARYPLCEGILDVRPDIPPIFIDGYLRSQLEGPHERQRPKNAPVRRDYALHTVWVRRDILNVFIKDVRDIGIVFLLAIITAFAAFGLKSIWALAGAGIVATALYSFFRIRSRTS